MADEKRESKKLPFGEIKSASTDRIKVGICAVFGNVDDGWDRIHPGAFTKTINEGRDRVLHLWNHDGNRLPTANILDLKEIGRNDLPSEVLDYAPMATGGLLVKREYLNNQKAKDVLECIEKGIIKEMSIGFNTVKCDFSVEDQKEIRELREVRLFDTSDVNWGMNDATVAVKSLYDHNPELCLSQYHEILIKLYSDIKAGRVISALNVEKLNSIHQTLIDLGSDKCIPKPENDESEKSKQAEAVKQDTSLRSAIANLELLKIQNLGVKL